MRIISLVNQKGGVGKTTTAFNLGAGLSYNGLKTLLIDLDPQSNLTQSLNFSQDKGNIVDLLKKEKPINDCLNKVNDNLFIIPSVKELAYLQPELMQDIGGNLRLKTALERLSTSFDYVLIDNSPTLGNFTYNALSSSHEAIICLQSDSIFSLTGLDLIINTIKETKESLNPNLKDFKILLNYYDKRKVITKNIYDSLVSNFKDKLLKTKIRQCLALSESQASKEDIFTYSKNSNGAEDYLNLTKEIIKDA